jgi:hypothetical protein
MAAVSVMDTDDASAPGGTTAGDAPYENERRRTISSSVTSASGPIVLPAIRG